MLSLKLDAEMLRIFEEAYKHDVLKRLFSDCEFDCEYVHIPETFKDETVDQLIAEGLAYRT